jgi:hypothetical protein
MILLAAAIRTESFWIDELSSAYAAAAPDWAGFVGRLGELGSEAQMPLHMGWLWLWARAFGIGEWTLRAANLPWAVLAVVAWIGLLRRLRIGLWGLWLLVSPFICYYMNEARPYLMTFATALLALWGVEGLCAGSPEREGRTGAPAVLIGVGLCAGASLLNLFLIPALAVYAFLRTRGQSASDLGSLVRRQIGLLVGVLILSACLAGYYAFTLVQGHGGQREAFSLVNVVYAVYEMLGFGGLGAPRILLRELSVSQVLSRYGVTLAIGLAGWVWVGWTLWRVRREILTGKTCGTAAAAFAAGALGLILVAVTFKAALWGRHFMAVLPLFLWAIVCALETARNTLRTEGRIAVWALIGLFLVSSFRQRALDDYRKDPMREAVAALGEVARYEPDLPNVALVYPLALRFYDRPSGGTTCVAEWPEARIRRWQREHLAYLILVHRTDKMDPGGIWTGGDERTRADIVWQEGNMRIYRIRRMPLPVEGA